GFTRYKYSAADGGYPMYYPYWNRHNDNANNSVMGNMEFQVVRNNIYKLRVTSINSLGHPVIPDDDPDPFDPEDPDEKEDVYFTVEVMILPWVVRVNDIDF
ncbi:MAG: fimbria major subunit, partial [Candidatus Amulumruptor sp.]|nr:fimbria major subunit [Candidatus Amulumruptor sp.]